MTRASGIAETDPAPDGQGRYRLWSKLPGQLVLDFIERFRNHDRSLPTQSKPVADFIRKGLNAELGEWDIAIVGKSDRGGNVTVDPDLGVVCQERTVGKESKGKDFVLVGEKNRVSSRGVERIGIPEGDRIAAEKDYVEREGRVEAGKLPGQDLPRASRTSSAADPAARSERRRSARCCEASDRLEHQLPRHDFRVSDRGIRGEHDVVE